MAHIEEAKLLELYPNEEEAYSTRKLYSSDELNVKCTCKIPEGLIKGGYCYAKDKEGKTVRPCEVGSGLNDLMVNADFKG